MVQRASLVILFFLLIFIHRSTVYGQNPDERIHTAWEAHKYAHYEKSINLFFLLHEEDPANINILQGLVESYTAWGWFFELNGEQGTPFYNQALIYAQKAFAVDKKDYRTHLMLGLCFQYKKNRKKAMQHFKIAQKQAPNEASPYFHQWILSEKTPEEKIKHPYLKKILNLDSSFADVYLHLGDIYKSIGNIQKSLQNYKKYLKLKPDYLAYYNVGNCYYQLNKPDLAIEYYEKSIEQINNYCWSYYMKGSALIAQSLFNKGVKNVKKAVNINPQVYSYYIQLQEYYPDLKEYKIDNPGDLQKTSPLSSILAHNYAEGIKNAENEKWLDAIALLEPLLAEISNSSHLYKNYHSSILNWLAHCYHQLGLYELASSYLLKSIELSQIQEVKQDLTSLKASLATIYYDWGNLRQAISYTKQSIEELNKLNIKTLDALAFHNLAQIFYHKEALDSSLHYTQKAYALNEKASNEKERIHNLILHAKIMLDKNELNFSDSIANLALEQATAIKDTTLANRLYYLKSKIEIKKRNFAKADYFFNKSHVLYLINKNEKYQNNINTIIITKTKILEGLNKPDSANSYFNMLFHNIHQQFKWYAPELSTEGKRYFIDKTTRFMNRFNQYVLRHINEYPELTNMMYNNKMLLYKHEKALNALQKDISPDESVNWKKWKDFHLLSERLKNNLASSGKGMPEQLESNALEFSKNEKHHIVINKYLKLFENDYWQELVPKLKNDEAVIEIIAIPVDNTALSNNKQQHYQFVALIVDKNTIKSPIMVLLSKKTLTKSEFIEGYSLHLSILLESIKEKNTQLAKCYISFDHFADTRELRKNKTKIKASFIPSSYIILK